MYCNQCGTAVDADSLYCYSCGYDLRSLEKIGELKSDYFQTKYKVVNSENLASVVILTLLCFKVFWVLSFYFAKDDNPFLDLIAYNDLVIRPTNVLFWAIPLFTALLGKSGRQRIFYVLIGLIIVSWSIYENFFS